MSGHSKWSQIKHKKALEDAKRSQLFAKLAREIEVAARSFGADPATNPRLASAIAEGRKAQFPKDKIEAALERARKQDGGEKIFWLEAYGPAGMAMLIGISTGGKEATLRKVKEVLKATAGKLAHPGEVRWQFKQDLSPLHALILPANARGQAQNCLNSLAALDGVVRIVHNAAL